MDKPFRNDSIHKLDEQKIETKANNLGVLCVEVPFSYSWCVRQLEIAI